MDPTLAPDESPQPDPGVWAKISGSASAAWDALWNTSSSLVQGATSRAEQAMTEGAAAAPGKVGNAISGAIAGAEQKAGSFLTSIGEGVKAGLNDVTQPLITPLILIVIIGVIVLIVVKRFE